MLFRSKKQLIDKAKQKGIYENFGQKEVQELQDKYGHYTKEIAEFDNWAMNFDTNDLKEYAKGGGVKQIEPQNEFGKYNEFIDMERTAKPAGFRYTNALAKKLRKDPQDAPTRQHIDKYKGKGVYFERRLDKSDANRNKKF